MAKKGIANGASGNSNSKPRRRRIITKKRKNELLKRFESLSKKKRVALVGHDSPDPDVFGNFRAWEHFFVEEGGVEAADTFAVSRGDETLQNQAIMKFLGVEFKDQKFFDEYIDHYGLVMFLDTREIHTSLEITPDIIWDHHKEEVIPPEDCLVIYEQLGAASTMSYLFFWDQGIKLPQDVILGLAIGIDRDTRSLQDEGATETDVEVLQELISKMDPEHFKLFNHYCHYPPVSASGLRRKGKACSNLKDEHNVAFAFLGGTEAEHDNSYGLLVDDLIRVQGVELAVVAGIREGEAVKVSVRVDSSSFVYEKVLKDVFKIDFYTSASWGGRNQSTGGALIPLTSYEKGRFRKKKEEFLEDKEEQIWSDILKFVTVTSST